MALGTPKGHHSWQSNVDNTSKHYLIQFQELIHIFFTLKCSQQRHEDWNIEVSKMQSQEKHSNMLIAYLPDSWHIDLNNYTII